MSAESQYPFLSRHRIAKPCKVKWGDMSGDEKKRFCGQCKLNVYNLSAMSSADAESLLKRTNGQICTYFYERADGTVLTQDCPVGVRSVYRQKGAIAAAIYILSLLIPAPLVRADGIKGRAHAIQMLGGAPSPMAKMGEPAALPSPAPTPKTQGKKTNCPLPLLGRPAVRR